MQAVCIAQAVNGKVRCAAWTLPFCKITPNCSINPFTPAVFSFLLQNKGRLTIPCFCVLVCAWLKVFTVSMAAQNQTFQVNSAELKNSLCFPDWTPCRLPITSSWFPFAHYMLPRIGTCILLMEKKKKKAKNCWLFICVYQSFNPEAVAAGQEMEAAAWGLWFGTSKFCLCLGLSIPILRIPSLDGFKWKEQGLQSMVALPAQPRHKWMDRQTVRGFTLEQQCHFRHKTSVNSARGVCFR